LLQCLLRLRARLFFRHAALLGLTVDVGLALRAFGGLVLHHALLFGLLRRLLLTRLLGRLGIGLLPGNGRLLLQACARLRLSLALLFLPAPAIDGLGLATHVVQEVLLLRILVLLLS